MRPKEVSEAEICPICYTSVCDVITCCNHSYCIPCISSWLNNENSPEPSDRWAAAAAAERLRGYALGRPRDGRGAGCRAGFVTVAQLRRSFHRILKEA